MLESADARVPLPLYPPDQEHVLVLRVRTAVKSRTLEKAIHHLYFIFSLCLRSCHSYSLETMQKFIISAALEYLKASGPLFNA